LDALNPTKSKIIFCMVYKLKEKNEKKGKKGKNGKYPIIDVVTLK
jgi:hypothetical protein